MPDIFMLFLAIWMFVGLFSSLSAIYIFRGKQVFCKTNELYLACIGPFLGPVIPLLVIIDLLRKN